MCGCECCQSSNPTCYDPTGRETFTRWLCRCTCPGCIVRFAEGHAAWTVAQQRVTP